MSWLDQFLLAVRQVAQSGVGFPQRGTLDFVGATVTDDEANDATIVTIGSGGITALTGDVTASGSGSVAATVEGLQGVSVDTSAPSNGQVLTYSASSGKWQPATPSAGTPSSLQTTYVVGEASGISAGDPVYVDGTTGQIFKARANTATTRNIIGVSLGTYAQTATATILLAGVGTPVGGPPINFAWNYFLADTGGITLSYAVGSGSMLIFIGVGGASGELCVSIRDYGTKP